MSTATPAAGSRGADWNNYADGTAARYSDLIDNLLRRDPSSKVHNWTNFRTIHRGSWSTAACHSSTLRVPFAAPLRDSESFVGPNRQRRWYSHYRHIGKCADENHYRHKFDFRWGPIRSCSELRWPCGKYELAAQDCALGFGSFSSCVATRSLQQIIQGIVIEPVEVAIRQEPSFIQ